MASCVGIRSNGNVRIDTTSIEDCSTFLLISPDEYQKFQQDNLVTVLDSLFGFDPVVFSVVSGTTMVLFLSAHGAGHVVRWLGRK